MDREADVRAVGLEYVEVVGRTLRQPARVIARMRAAADRAVHLERRWQLAPRAGPSLDEVLDRRDT